MDEKYVLGEQIRSHSNCLNTPAHPLHEYNHLSGMLPSFNLCLINVCTEQPRDICRLLGGRTWEKPWSNAVNFLLPIHQIPLILLKSKGKLLLSLAFVIPESKLHNSQLAQF